jgi:hypothetical protein
MCIDQHSHANPILPANLVRELPMKTERVTFLATTQFKAYLAAEAEKAGMSVGELVRQRCQQQPGADEQLLAALAVELRHAVREAQTSLGDGLAAVDAALAERHSAAAPAAQAGGGR